VNKAKWETLIKQDLILSIVGAVLLLLTFTLNVGYIGVLTLSIGCLLIGFALYEFTRLIGKSYIQNPTE
jgi:hypothetical protein